MIQEKIQTFNRKFIFEYYYEDPINIVIVNDHIYVTG
jgi:hypothetical protein